MGGTRHQRTELAANVIPDSEQSPRLQHFLQCLRGALAERAMFDQLDMLVMLGYVFRYQRPGTSALCRAPSVVF